METIFSEIDLKVGVGEYIAQKMPDVFIKIGHGLTDIVIDLQILNFSNQQIMN